MYFNSVEQILTQLEQQPGWEKFREYRQLLKCWQNTVSQNTAKHTRPLHITRQILWVATSSATRAQELSFQRYSLLKKLNQQLTFPLKDIRFSSSQWHQATQQNSTNPSLFNISSQQKTPIKSKNNLSDSRVFDPGSKNIKGKSPTTSSSPTTAKAAAQRWLESVKQNKQNSSSFLACSNCSSLTPIGEIERWGLCHHCIAQKWSREYRPPTFPEPK